MRARRATYMADAARVGERNRWAMHGRLIAFLGAITCLVWAAVSGHSLLPFVGTALCSVAFVLLVTVHGKTGWEMRWYDALAEVWEDAEKRLLRDWGRLTQPGAVMVPDEHPYAADLNLSGHASVLKLLGTVRTAPGLETLWSWLLEAASPATILQRQEAVTELAGRLDFREQLLARGRLIGPVRSQVVEGFVAWALEKPWLLGRPWLVWSASLIPAATLVLFVAQVVGWLAYPFWLLPLFAGIAVTVPLRQGIDDQLDRASSGDTGLRRYGELFELLSSEQFRSPLLAALQRELSGEGVTAHARMRKFSRVLACADLRHSDLMHFAIHAVTLWDFHVLRSLEQWKLANGSHIESWLSALGSIEALAAFAAVAFSHPDWRIPEIVRDGESMIAAEGLGHPLLHPDVCVANDVTVGPPGTLLLISGSNMSGKSTLLRAIGLNTVLAQAGGPVCARRMRLSPLDVYASVNVQDSLERGVSLFMAELTRVKQIVDAARRAGSQGDRQTLYLLDDVLHGTNTGERQIAVRRILRGLLDAGAIGVVTTHDLALASSADLESACRAVHFRETAEMGEAGPRLSFDYQLRPGLAVTTNALKLMEMVGIDDRRLTIDD
ncbi:MAG: hypothetical protein AMS18_01575 [Gemmatimonas sp. SG8_17]|nr:MAG: hypothetical protein AMS18_01575 [Gemmatimonas sp. SG8_17]